MPLHLTSPSRRDFLAASLAAAGVFTWHAARGEDGATDPDRWALLSDTHICAQREFVHRGVKMARNLERAVAAITALRPRPTGVLLNGDAAFLAGAVGDYRLVLELLLPLTKAHLPIHITLGNHDHRERFQAGLKPVLGRSLLESRQVAIVQTRRANWFLLDSLQRVTSTPGELGRAQLAWLAHALDAHPREPALIMLHHNPQWSEAAHRSGLVDTEALFAVLERRQQVKAVVFGHTHVWQHARHHGLHLLNLPPTAYLFDNTSPNGWVDFELHEGGAKATLHALDPHHRQNGQSISLAWR